jgi:MFS transporter, OPA family, sugar phosphate sensor protein UhpC
MWQTILKFYAKSSHVQLEEDLQKQKSKFKKLRWSVFLSSTIGYSLFYVCRLSLSVVKKTILNEGWLNKTQMGIIGLALFFTYAVGRFTNGFLADRSNIKRFMSTGLLVSSDGCRGWCLRNCKLC